MQHIYTLITAAAARTRLHYDVDTTNAHHITVHAPDRRTLRIRAEYGPDAHTYGDPDQWRFTAMTYRNAAAAEADRPIGHHQGDREQAATFIDGWFAAHDRSPEPDYAAAIDHLALAAAATIEMQDDFDDAAPALLRALVRDDHAKLRAGIVALAKRIETTAERNADPTLHADPRIRHTTRAILDDVANARDALA